MQLFVTVARDSPQFVLVCDYTALCSQTTGYLLPSTTLWSSLFRESFTVARQGSSPRPPLQRPEASTPLPPQKPPFHEKWQIDDRLTLPQGSWFLVNGLILSPGNPCWRPVVGAGSAFGGGMGQSEQGSLSFLSCLGRPEVLAVQTERGGRYLGS